MKKRILVLLTVVVVMVVMLAMSVVPAFAQGASPFGHCEKFVHQHSGFHGPDPCIRPNEI
jgi:hypothetical protein